MTILSTVHKADKFESHNFLKLNFSNIWAHHSNFNGYESFLKLNTPDTVANFMAPFYGWGSTASRLEPLQGDSLLFITKYPEITGTHFTNLRRIKSWVDLEAIQ